MGWSRARTDARVDELLKMVGLEPSEFRPRMPAELSGGQQQRVGLARALAASPRVVLMDEPFGALDPVTRSDLRREVVKIQRLLRLTTIMVTHDVVEALLLADEIVVLDDGRIVQRGSPQELWTHPVGGFVERLLSAPREDLHTLEQLLEGTRP
jgi:osmoprotectant transport system ATP-binding protein